MKKNPATFESRRRLLSLGISLGVGVVAIAAMSLLFDDAESVMGEIGNFLLDRHTQQFHYPFTVQNLMWLVFFIGCGELWIRHARSNHEIEQLERGYLPEDHETVLTSRDLVPIYEKAAAATEEAISFTQRLIMRCVLQFQSSRSVSQSHSLLNASLELFQHELDLKYSMLRYLVWLLPTLGFIGTIVGIAFALDFAAKFQDPQSPNLLAELTGRLGVAFYTTLLALIQSALLVFALHIIQGREEAALNQSGQYCLDNLINRLYEK